MEHISPSKAVAYIAPDQKACATNTPVMYARPYIQDRACGAVLLRSGQSKKRTEPQTDVLARGEIGAMMHFANLQIINADSADNYINIC
jgi:hypothetical protein